MNADPLAPIRRILLALDAGMESAASLETMAVLASELDAELDALFIEDEELLRLARLPFAGELGLVSAARRPLSDIDLQQTLRSQAARQQRQLAATATRSQLRWSFQVRRGALSTCVAEAAAGADIVTVSLSADPAQRWHESSRVQRLLAGAARPLLVLPAGAMPHPPFAVVYDAGDAARRALHLAAQLSRHSDTPVRVLLMAEGVARRREAEGVLAGHHVNGEFRTFLGAGMEDIARAARVEAAGVLLVPVAGALQQPDRIGKLLSAAGRAVLFVP